MKHLIEPKIDYHESPSGRLVTVKLEEKFVLGNVSVRFLDEARPDETNREERVRILAFAKVLFQEAVDRL